MQSSHPKTLSVLDPTSLLGRDVAEGIARTLPEVRPRWFHTRADEESLIVEIAGNAALVPPLADPKELAGSDAVLITAQPSPAIAERLLGWLRAHPDVVLLDCSQPGVAREETRCVLDRGPAHPPTLPWYHLADPAVAVPARFVAALAPLDPHVLHLTVMCPVASLGEEALDELASQGAARLSGQPIPKPSRLPAPLAFDLAPAPSDREVTLEAQLGELLSGVESRVHAVDAGVFHGYLTTVLVQCRARLTADHVRGLVRAAEGFRMARRGESLTTTRAVEQGTTVVCGGLRIEGGWVSAWLLADGLAVGGARAVLEIVRSFSAC